ncbi:MAG: hypothetical protein JWN86_2686 [Planctomycetota bacterium]|nr:hypothetical protein [Planctomycetota bacterium]
MGVSSGRSRVADLGFHVFGRSVHPDWFAVRVHSRITRTGWEADARIVEGGHVITWASGDVRLTEILAGPETLLPDLGLLFHSHVKHERSTRLAPDGRVEYQTCFEAERLDAEVFAHLNEELILDASSGDLFHRFAPANRMAPSPMSRIHVEARSRGLSIQAFHTFPEERAIVRVQSLFEIIG